ncbi:hypothetical protein BCR44DRAFT_165070 [Catenaria anguillulae PL171]|uniref:Uncharacterized protein n=1 Tax=Catenaria anguillulae PL171 TaxID=765915 RepID=A0A1Y2HJH8_9FUNG|nr:hypothetical protein BCR44DRAFT_165070 [Catenaria anguillulae PL171]
MKSSQSAVLRQTASPVRPAGTEPTSPPGAHSHQAMASTTSISGQSFNQTPEAISPGKKSSSFNVLNKAAPLFKASMPSLAPAVASPASSRPPLTSDIDALLSIEANTSDAGAPAASSSAAGGVSPSSTPMTQVRPRGVSQLVASKFKSATASNSSQVTPFQRSVSTKSAKQHSSIPATPGTPVISAAVAIDDQYVPEPHLPHLRHGRKNMDIDSIMAEVEERVRTGSAPPVDSATTTNGNPENLRPLLGRSSSKRSFRRWSMPGLTNQTRDPSDSGAKSAEAAGSRPASSGLTARIGQLASTITSPLRRRHRSMQELSTPHAHAAAGAPPRLTAAEGASMRDLPLPAPMDIDELLTRFGTSDSYLVRGARAGDGRATKQSKQAPMSHPHQDSLVIVRTSPVSRHMSTSSGPPIRVPGDDTSSIRPLRRPSNADDTTDSADRSLVNSNEAVHRAGNLLASGTSTPTSMSAFSSNDRMSVQAMYTSTFPRGADDAHPAAPTGGVSIAPNVATIIESSQAMLPAPPAANSPHAHVESVASDVSSIASVDVDTSNARALVALRAMPRVVLDKVYVHHCNDIDAVVTPSEGLGGAK